MTATTLDEPITEQSNSTPNMNDGRQEQEHSRRRPAPAMLVSLTREYVSRLDECEQKRRSAQQNMRRRYARRKASAKPTYREQQASYNQRLQAATLGDLWRQYCADHPNADFTHELAFLGWAHATGAYPHGRDALTQDWMNAGAGRHVTDRNRPRRPDPTTPRPPPNRPTSTQANAPRPTQSPASSPKENAKATLSTRNWIIGALIAGAIILAAAASSSTHKRQAIMNIDWTLALAAGITITAGISAIIHLMDAPRTDQISLWIVGSGRSALYALNVHYRKEQRQKDDAKQSKHRCPEDTDLSPAKGYNHDQDSSWPCRQRRHRDQESR